MGFFDGLGDIFHSIGSFFGGGNNNNQNNNQQHNQPPVAVHPTIAGPAAGPQFNQNQNPVFIQHNNQQQPNQQQPQPVPTLNLYQGPNVNPNWHPPMAGSFDPNSPFLIKANQPQPAPQPQAQPSKPGHSIWNDVVNVGKGIVKAPVQLLNQAGDELANVGITGKTEYDLLTHADPNTINNDFAMEKAGSDVYDQNHGGLFNMGTITSAADAKNPNVGKVAKEFGGNFVQNAALVAAPGVDSLAEKGASMVLPEVTSAGGKIAANLLTKAGTGAVVGGTAGAGQGLEDGTSMLKGAAEGAGIGAGAGVGFGVAAPFLRKVIPGIVDSVKNGWDDGMNPATDVKVATGALKPDEIEPGIKSANPNQGADALAAIQQKEAQQIAATPQPQAGAPIQGGEPAPATAGPGAQATSELQPAETPQNAAQTPNNQVPPTRTSNTAPNAPNIRAQAQKDLDSIGKQVDQQTANEIGSSKEHDVLTNEQLNDAAQRYAQSMSDDQLKQSVEQGMTVNGAGDIAKAYAVVKRLGQMAANGDEQAKQLIPNLLDSVEQHVSGAGRSMNYTGSMLDSLPKEAQLEYIIKDINRTRANSSLDPLSDEEEQNARDTLTKYLTEIEAKKDAAAAAQGSIDEIMARAEKGEATPEDIKSIADYQKTAEQNTREAQQLNTQVGKAYLELAPQKGNFAKTAGDYARSSMLTKVTGRLSDVATTGINAAHSLIQNTVENGMGKVLNKITGNPGQFSDTMPSVKAMVQGTGQGARDLASNYSGNVETPDLYSAIRQKGMGGKAQLANANSGNAVSQFVRKTGHAMAETATNLSQGVGTNKMYQMASQEAKQMGLEGDQAKVWVAGRVANPTPEMQRAGSQLVDEVNNMNDNKLTDLMSKLSKAFTDSKAGQSIENSKLGKASEFVGEQIRNIVAPFTRWAAGAAWNGATDKNAVANIVKIINNVGFKDGSLTAKDPQELVHQIAGLATNTAGAMSAGYALASNGLITTTNSEGYNDEGMYLHIGSHYIPIGFLGFFAPGVVMGAAAHQAMNDKTPGKSVIDKVKDAAGTTFGAMARSDLTNTMLGGSNEFVKQVQEALQNKNGITGTDVAATGATDAAGSYIPGIAGDANSAINEFNIGNLNPTHEAGLTKVTKGETGQLTKTGAPSTAKDIPRSDVNALLNKVPVAGQLMVPRNPGVAANDLLSNVTRGDNESPQQSEENKQIAQLPQKLQPTVRTALLKNNGAAQMEAQKSADALPNGPQKVKAQQAADKMAFTAQQNTLDKTIADAKTKDQVDQFKQNGSGIKTIGDKTYANVNGSVQSFDTPLKAQQAIDAEKFKQSGKDFDTINGTVYQKGSDGKITAMEQKDFDYKNASDAIKDASSNKDLNGTLAAQSKLLDNIQWQLNHAQLTGAARGSLIDTAAKTQADFNKYALWGDFTKPKGAPSYEPKFDNTTPKSSAYIQTIKEAGAKYGVDINALLSVAAQEGLGGGVGDNGTSFGPFQLHEGGALPPGKDQAWAESPEGIDYAVQQIANVAKGKVGKDAIDAIVHQFEKSADPETEAANALALYEGGTAHLNSTSGIGSSVDSSTSGSGSSASKQAALVKSNVIGSVPQQARESFIENGMTNKPVTLNLPQVKLTDPQTLIKAHKITVGMPKA